MQRFLAAAIAAVLMIGVGDVAAHTTPRHSPAAVGALADAASVGVRPAPTAASRDYDRPDLDKALIVKARERAARLARQRALRIAHARAVAAAAARARAAAAAAARRRRAAAASSYLNSSAEAWAHSSFAEKVANCESGGNIHAVNGQYHGKWQMDPDFWRTYGGLRFASDPLYATEAQQDYVAWRGWRARGWEPWQCASMV